MSLRFPLAQAILFFWAVSGGDKSGGIRKSNLLFCGACRAVERRVERAGEARERAGHSPVLSRRSFCLA